MDTEYNVLIHNKSFELNDKGHDKMKLKLPPESYPNVGDIIKFVGFYEQIVVSRSWADPRGGELPILLLIVERTDNK